MRKSNIWLAAAGIVIKGSEALVVKKAYGGLKGKWSFPAGFVQPGETVDQAAVREVYEETGITAVVRQVAAVRTGVIKEEISDNMIVFVMDYVSGQPRPQEGEIEETRFFPISELINHPFGTEYMRIILPKVPHLTESLTGNDYEPDPVFGYTTYRIFT
ncbi:NUDIX domain-containing protein [Brevibacillus humidisoli]|uniref:NUDIX domain-containing protein n=1 Tax=Brevibacillus humidisoli TaxID=2895522 RepID=UPI001E3CE167|nr:NUDIX domain-containing protein [Brevibacillus humidisoli]UFJ39654.1 NUDIX domain-containing protein [Brevibacillus humidisoli]